MRSSGTHDRVVFVSSAVWTGDASGAPDPGLFGPGSVTWRVHSEPLLWLGGIRALLLQAVHPLAMAGVMGHSNFRDDPWGRLFRTAQYVGTVTYGTTEDARRAAARVRGIHGQVRGIDPVTHRAYRASDPALLTWVHVTEVDSFLSTARRGGLKLTAQEADQYVAEQLRAGELLGVPASMAPHSVAEIDEYYRRVRPDLQVGPAAREVAGFILHPPMPRKIAFLTPARPAWYGLGALAFASLPRWTRRMYALPGLPTTDLVATVAARGMRAGLMRAPERYREGPAYLAAQERLGLR
jgi:uncharacterized protein (DUF2236 family)